MEQQQIGEIAKCLLFWFFQPGDHYTPNQTLSIFSGGTSIALMHGNFLSLMHTPKV